MKVEVKFTANVVERLTKNPGYITVEAIEPFFCISVPSEWVTPLPIEEPKEFGYYKLTFDDFVIVTELVRHNCWYLTGNSDQWSWEELLKFLTSKTLTAVERII